MEVCSKDKQQKCIISGCGWWWTGLSQDWAGQKLGCGERISWLQQQPAGPATPRQGWGEERGVFTDIVSPLLRYSAAHVSCVESHRSVPILPGKAGALQPPLLYCVLKVQVAPLCLLPRSAPAWLLLAPTPSITRLQFNCYQGFLQFRLGPSSRYAISLPADSVWSPCTLQGT